MRDTQNAHDPPPHKKEVINMAGLDKAVKEAEIKKEESRLRRTYSKIGKKRKATIEGLIQRAAFMRISLAELEADLNENGFTEWFSQGDQSPYLRKRPTAEVYSSMNTGYQKIIKQLTDLLPEEKTGTQEDDGFDGFINGRDDA